MRAAVVLLFALAAPAWAIGEWEGENASLDAVGSARLLGGWFHNRELEAPLPTPPDDGIGAAVFRLLVDGHLWKVDYDANFFLELSRGPLGTGSSAFATAGSFVTPYRTQYLQWNYWKQGFVSGQLGVDRLAFSRDFGPARVTVGRFPINYAVTSLISPNDFFAPFSATSVNRIFKPGVDAVRVKFTLSRVSGLEVVGVLGSDLSGRPAWKQSAVMLRLDTVAAGFQLAVLGGKLAQRYVVGGTLQGDVGPVTLRAEGHLGIPDRNDDGVVDGPLHGRVAAHVEHTFEWHSLSLGAEYAYFSDGAPLPSGYLARVGRFFPDDLLYLSNHYLGVTAGVEIYPLLRAGLVSLINAQDGSGIGVFSLAYSAADEVDFSLGALAGWGATPAADGAGGVRLRSEYGATPITVFLEARVSL